MKFSELDRSSSFGARVIKRLQEERIIWLISVDSRGFPQPAPVWFLWNESAQSLLIYSLKDAKREAHLKSNPHIALNFDGDKAGGDIIVLTGDVEFVADEPSAAKNPAYVQKYQNFITRSFGTPENFAERYPIALQVRPQSIRGH